MVIECVGFPAGFSGKGRREEAEDRQQGEGGGESEREEREVWLTTPKGDANLQETSPKCALRLSLCLPHVSPTVKALYSETQQQIVMELEASPVRVYVFAHCCKFLELKTMEVQCPSKSLRLGNPGMPAVLRRLFLGPRGSHKAPMVVV